jgi:hypothetical protein
LLWGSLENFCYVDAIVQVAGLRLHQGPGPTTCTTRHRRRGVDAATRAGIAPVVDAAIGARRTLRAIRRGIAISLGYNLAGIGLAVAGLPASCGSVDAAQLDFSGQAGAAGADLRTKRTRQAMSIIFLILPSPCYFR